MIINVYTYSQPSMSWTLSFTLIVIGLFFSVVTVVSAGMYEMLSRKDILSDKYGKYMAAYFISLCPAVFPLLAGVGGIVENTGNTLYFLLILAYTVLYFGSIIVTVALIKRKYETT